MASHPFSKRRWQAIELVAEGYSLYEIADRMGLKATTLRQHLWEARRLVGAATVGGLVAECYERGWLVTELARIEHEEEVEEWPKITPGQRLYLDAFDRFLLANRTLDRVVARAEMRHHLKSMCIEKGDGIPDSIHGRLALAA